MEPVFYTVEEVQELLRVGRSKAYQVIFEVNQELKTKGYLTIPGRVHKKALMERIGGEVK